MAFANPQFAPPPTSLVDELSKLISDPRTKVAITSITLRDGTIVELNPNRQQCRVCKNFIAVEPLPYGHKDRCHRTCKQHTLFDAVSLDFDHNRFSLK